MIIYLEYDTLLFYTFQIYFYHYVLMIDKMETLLLTQQQLCHLIQTLQLVDGIKA